MSHEPRIAIIGAGVSGLSAADALINRYKLTNVTLFEASDRVGGRVRSVDVEDQWFHLGAEFLHNASTQLYQ